MSPRPIRLRELITKNMEPKSKKMLVLVAVVIVVALIVLVAAMQSRKNMQPEATPSDNQTNTQTQTTPEATTSAPVIALPEAIKDATIVAPGASPITKDDKVVTLDGKQTVNNVSETSPLAPSQSGPVKIDNLAPSVIKITASASGYTPNSFTVKPGAAVTVALTGIDSAHTLVYEDASMSAVDLGVYKDETKVISFNAPTKPGEYIFFCNVGAHRSRGEQGKMIVK